MDMDVNALLVRNVAACRASRIVLASRIDIDVICKNDNDRTKPLKKLHRMSRSDCRAVK
jgi:hypothetical protein